MNFLTLKLKNSSSGYSVARLRAGNAKDGTAGGAVASIGMDHTWAHPCTMLMMYGVNSCSKELAELGMPEEA